VIKIPAGTQSGAVFRVKGRGVKNLQGYGHGDLHARIQVEVPARLTGEQKAKNGHPVQKREQPRHNRRNVSTRPVTKGSLKSWVRLKRRKYAKPQLHVHKDKMHNAACEPGNS